MDCIEGGTEATDRRAAVELVAGAALGGDSVDYTASGSGGTVRSHATSRECAPVERPRMIARRPPATAERPQ